MGKKNVINHRASDRRGNAVQKMLRAIDCEMFPGGEVEEMEYVTRLCEMLGGRYDSKDIDTTLRYILSALFMSEDRSKSKVVSSVIERPYNSFSETDIRKIMDFAIRNNESLSLLYK